MMEGAHWGLLSVARVQPSPPASPCAGPTLRTPSSRPGRCSGVIKAADPAAAAAEYRAAGWQAYEASLQA